MESEQKYTLDSYFVEDEFVVALKRFKTRTAMKIANNIDENISVFPINAFTSTILGGMVFDDDDNPITFALEIIKEEGSHPTLTDIKIISMDEYLDLYNLNLIIKNGEKRSTEGDT